MDEQLTKRELDIHFEGVHEKLDRLSDKVDATNGRVRKIEVWRGYITGAVAALSVVLGMVAPLLVIMMQKL